MANKRLPLNKQLQVLYNTPEELRGLNDLCIKMTGKNLGYGGIVYIQDSGEKKKDSIYLDRFKPGLYYCKANSTTTSNDTSIFIDYSNYTIGNKLENLAIPNTISRSSKEYFGANFYLFSNMVFITIFSVGKTLVKDDIDTMDIKPKLNGRTTLKSFSSIVGNNGSTGIINIDNGIIELVATSTGGLIHKYHGIIFVRLY